MAKKARSSGTRYRFDPRCIEASSFLRSNRLVAPASRTWYGYDPQNKRVWQWSGTLDSAGNPVNYLVNFYGVDGKRLGQYQFSNTNCVNCEYLTATLVTSRPALR